MKLHKSALEKVVDRETRVCKEPLFSSYKSWGIAREPHVEVFTKSDHGWLKRPSAKGRDGARDRNFGYRERTIVGFRESS